MLLQRLENQDLSMTLSDLAKLVKVWTDLAAGMYLLSNPLR